MGKYGDVGVSSEVYGEVEEVVSEDGVYHFRVDLNIDGQVGGADPEEREYYMEVEASTYDAAKRIAEDYVEEYVLDHAREEWIWAAYPISREEYEAAKVHETFPIVRVE